MSVFKTGPLRFLPVILISLGFIFLGMYKTFHKVFDVRQAVVSNYYNPVDNPAINTSQSATPSAKVIPTVADGGKIIKQALLNTTCKIDVQTDKKDYTITTEGLTGNCKNEQFGKISPTGEYLAFTGTMGRTASLLKLFVLSYEKTVTLGSWKDAEIIDYIFLPDDRLIVLVDNQNSMLLESYDTEQIAKDFSAVFNQLTSYVNPGKRHASIEVNAPGGESLNYKNGKILVLTKEKNVVLQADPQSIILESRLATVSPARAIQMAMNYYKENENGTGTKGTFDMAGSSDTEWKVNVSTPGGMTVKQYMVNNETGVIK